MGAEHEVEMSLRRTFSEKVKGIVSVAKEDLSLANHLSGLKKSYFKLLFNNTRDLMDVRKLLLPAVQKNGDKRKAQTVYDGCDGVAASSWLDSIEDIREYDVRAVCCALSRCSFLNSILFRAGAVPSPICNRC